MPHTLGQILPSLQSLGDLGYWLIGLASALEAFFLSGAILPGTLIVDAGGILVQRGVLDFFDLAWFVAVGSILGSELSYWTGRLAMNRLPGRRRIESSRTFARAEALFRRRGGLALLFGRFMGPVAGLVPLAAAMVGMERRKFLIWNILGSIPYALVHVAIGYFLGDVMGRIGGSLTRVAVLAGVVALLLSVLWGLLYSALRLLPLALTILSVAIRSLGDLPAVARRIDAHPETARWVAARFDGTSFAGLPLSGLALVFLYVGSVWLDSVADFLSGDPMLRLDMRLAELIHHFQSPVPIRIASWFTATGGWQVVWPLVTACLVWLLLERRRPLAIGLLVSVLGSTASVAVLKLLFQRPRSPLGYFLETSNSFPSGHAAASVGAYGMFMYVLWRAGKLRAETALLAAGLAAFAIGVSRIYLIEHYLTDVLNGWLVGLLWVIVGIAVSEWLSSRQTSDGTVRQVRGWWRMAGLAAVVALVSFAAVNVWSYDHPRNTPMHAADIVLSDPQELAHAGNFPAITESLLGSPLRPISLIVLARDEAALSRAIVASGWTESKAPTPGVILDALYSAVEGREDPTVETVSQFWRGQSNDLAFVKRSHGQRGTSDHLMHARFWRSDYVTPAGLRAFPGSLGVDENVGSEPSSTGIGSQAARDTLVSGLLGRGATIMARIALPTSNRPGQSASIPPGETIVLALP
jgi:membrane protein DedA with SNARE-associated domain/membrane-associated phospholipid phosphatase